MHKSLEDQFRKSKDVVFFHLQTVWEAEETNTPERGPRETKAFKIEVPVGYDAHVDGARTSVAMQRYGTGGTPWTLVLDKQGVVRFSDVTPMPDDAEALSRLVEELLAENEG